MPRVTAVIAAKDEEKYIRKVVLETKKYVDSVIVVDDGSIDKTTEESFNAGAIVLTHPINLGKGSAIRTGCEYAVENGTDTIILIDADGQHKPKEISILLKKLGKNDIVFGIRKQKKTMPQILKFGNYMINKITRVLYGIYIPDTQCGFRVFKARVYEKIKWNADDYSMESEMIANVGKQGLKYTFANVSTIYSDKYKGTTILDGFKIVFNMLWWRLTR